MTATLAFAGTAAAAFFSDVSTGDTLDPTLAITPSDLRTPDPNDPYAGKALNILVVGSDMRDAKNAAVAGAANGGGGDTTLLVHISGDRSWVEVVSIPRDSMVDLPACNLPDGSMSKPQTHAQFNTAFSIGTDGFDPTNATEEDMNQALEYGVSCTQTAVSALTRVPITNTVVLQMVGVIGVVDALGGVTMCLDEPVVGSKKESPDLNLPSGQVTLDGRTSLAFLRARHGKGLGLEAGSDLTRITRQQAFIDNAMNQMLDGGILANVPQLYQMLGQALQSIRTDPALDSVTELGGLAFSLKGLDPNRIVFTELPVVDDPKNPKARVVWTPAADEIWARMGADQPPPQLAPAPAPAAPAPSNSAAPAPADPAAPAPSAPAVTDPAPAEPVPSADRLPGVCYDGWVPPAS